MKKSIVILLLFAFTVHTSFSQSRAEKKQLKREKVIKAYTQTKSLLDTGVYTFDAEWMYPRNSVQLNLVGNPGYIRINGNAIDMYLPYRGVVRIGGGLNQRAGIYHDGELTSYTITHNDDKQASEINLQVRTTVELFDINIRVQSKANTTVFISSSKRDGIRYQGIIIPQEKSRTK